MRIRKAQTTGQMHSSLLEIKARAVLPPMVLQDPKRALLVKTNQPSFLQAKPANEEEKSDTESSQSQNLEELVTAKIREAMKRSSRAKREFFSGCKFQLRMDTIEVRVHSAIREIVEYKMVHPNLHAKINNICLKVGFTGPDLVAQFSIREIQVFDYFRNEES